MTILMHGRSGESASFHGEDIRIKGKRIHENGYFRVGSGKVWKGAFCTSFNVFLPKNFDILIKTAVFNRMLSKQVAILNFLVEQKTAVINGAAGMGKTIIAVEKARRNAAKGEKVLFLCYNSEPRKYLEKG